jgi:hypothetical protein
MESFTPPQPDTIADARMAPVPPEHWNDLAALDRDDICRRALARSGPDDSLMLPFLNRELWVERTDRCIHCRSNGGWEVVDSELLALLALVYLQTAREAPLSGEMIGINQLREAHFFRGPHAPDTQCLLDRFGRNASGFATAAQNLDGTPLELADAAYRLLPFPRVPLYCLLWEGDEEFEPQVSVLFDRSVEMHLAADAIWGLISLVSHEMAGENTTGQ